MARFNIEIDPRTMKGLREIPHGFKSRIVRQFLKSLVSSYQKHGERALGAFTTGEYELVPIAEKRGENFTKSSKRKEV